MISRILCFAHSMLANTRNSDPAHSLNIHHTGNCHKHREYRICRGPKKDEKDTYIPSHPQSGPTPGSDALTHQVIVLSLIHISEPTRLRRISYAVFCLK